jgi:hypothetical protein
MKGTWNEQKSFPEKVDTKPENKKAQEQMRRTCEPSRHSTLSRNPRHQLASAPGTQNPSVMLHDTFAAKMAGARNASSHRFAIGMMQTALKR